MTNVSEQQVITVCQRGRGAATCSYLTFSGFRGGGCAKSNPALKNMIDARRATGTIGAMGDNCSGPPDFVPTGQAVRTE